jgi:hypothetical protein
MDSGESPCAACRNLQVSRCPGTAGRFIEEFLGVISRGVRRQKRRGEGPVGTVAATHSNAAGLTQMVISMGEVPSRTATVGPPLSR